MPYKWWKESVSSRHLRIFSPLHRPSLLSFHMEHPRRIELILTDYETVVLPLNYGCTSVVCSERFELPTKRFEATYSIPLSYEHWCHEAGLNCRLVDYDSATLPTELS